MAKTGALDVFGNSTYAIALLLKVVGPLTFTEIKKRVPYTEATIAKRLKQLKRAGFIEEEAFIAENRRPSKRYRLTELGEKYVEYLGWAMRTFYGEEAIKVVDGKVIMNKELLKKGPDV